MDIANSNPYRSACSVTVRLRSKGRHVLRQVVEMIQPLLPIGTKTPSSIVSSCHPQDGSRPILVHSQSS